MNAVRTGISGRGWPRAADCLPIFIFLGLALGGGAGLAQPRTIRVPEDFPTISAAISNASSTFVDTVLVGPGVYNEAVTFGNKDVRLVSEGGPSVTSILAPAGLCAVALGQVTTNSLLFGFTLTNSSTGVGVSATGSPFIVSNVIVGCGTGIATTSAGSSLRIQGNRIISCATVGISLPGAQSPFIEGNLLQSNQVAISFSGATVSPTILNNTMGNTTGNAIDMGSAWGGYVIQNLIFNTSGYGIWAFVPGGAPGYIILNNTVVSEGASSAAAIGIRGICSSTVLFNNIVVGVQGVWCGGDAGNFPFLAYNDVFSRSGVTYAGYLADQTGVHGNISADPHFVCEPSQDFRTFSGSPCIDAGTNVGPALPPTDLAGGPRTLPGQGGGQPKVDMGAFEFDPACPPTPCLFLVCPSNLVVFAPPGQSSAVVSYPAPFGTPGAVTSSPPSGSVFAAGDNLVGVSATWGTSVLSCAFTITVLTTNSLGLALDATNLSWGVLGNAGWFVETNTTYDGVAAAQSGPVPNGQAASLYTVLLGPGTLSFWWSVSCIGLPLNRGILSLNVDGVTQAALFGTTSWEQQSIVLSPGEHLVEWTFTNSATVGTAQDTGWLDQVAYTGQPGPLAVFCPSNIAVVASPGQTSAAVAYDTPLATPGATVGTSPASGSAFPAGDTMVAVTATQGTNVASCSFTISVLTTNDFARGLNATNLDWTTSGDAPWFVEAAVTHDGVAAAQSGAITTNQASTLQTTLAGPGVLGFWWKVSSLANHGLLSVAVNGATQAVISGAVDWQPQTLYLGSGPQAVQWTYCKDASAAGGQDAGWLDQVSFAPGPVAPLITVQPASVTAGLGLSATFSVAALGAPPLSYQWRFDGQSIAGATNATLVITNVQATNVGTYSVLVMNQVGSVFSSNVTLTLAGLVAWGSNTYGQTNVPPNLTNVLAIGGGWHHSVALRGDGTVVAWGDNTYGQTNVPAGLSNVIAISSRSGDDVMALRADGTVAVWGSNATGQTNVPAGLSNVVAVAIGGYDCLALKADGALVAWGQLPGPTPSGSNFVALAAGDLGSLFLKADGTVAAAGTTVPAGLSNVVAIAAGGEHYLALHTSGTVTAWGDNSQGQASVPAGLSNVVAIQAGDYHSLALKADGTVAIWGDYTTNETTFFPAWTLPGLTNVAAIAAGSDHDLALLGNGPPLAFGLGNVGWAGGVLTVAVPTQSGRVYRLEYKNSLTDSAWTGLPLVPGNGGIQVLSDAAASGAQRFYRVSRW